MKAETREKLTLWLLIASVILGLINLLR